MDAIVALGLAANVAQFIEFAHGLISSAREICSSVSGASKEAESLEYIYSRLQICSRDLSLPASATLTAADAALLALAAKCDKDCRELLNIVQRLKREPGSKHRRWKSFQKAMLTVWEADRISQLTERIQDCRGVMVIQLCVATSSATTRMEEQLSQLKAENRSFDSERREQLSSLHETLLRVERGVSDIRSAGGKTNLVSDKTEDLVQRVSELSLVAAGAQELVDRQQAIVDSLAFEQRLIRYEAIPTAHCRTFEWVFDQGDASEDCTRGQFIRWLGSDEGLFWITGKPGSGKSTLMKFLARHEQLKVTLDKSAGHKRSVIVDHYFWNSGTPLQKKMEGLLRSLLCQVLSEVPELIPAVCAERWTEPGRGTQTLRHRLWTFAQLQDALALFAALENVPAKFLLLIDGLDEYEGDHTELCKILTNLASCTHVRLCVSSRPWNVFEDYFGRKECNKLYIHRLIDGDIRKYVETELSKHSRWAIVAGEMDDAGEPAAFFDQITEHAQGVFLWVFLVCRLLQEGLTNYDSVSDLRRRLDILPRELEPFFKHMLEAVDPFYHEKMAGSLLIASTANQPLEVLVHYFHDMEYDDRQYAVKQPLEILSDERGESIDEIVARRLNGRCKGLLELHHGKIWFLHRTVRDFLRTREMSDFLASKCSPDFDAHLALLSGFAAMIKRKIYREPVMRYSAGNYGEGPFIVDLLGALDYAAIAVDDAERFCPAETLLDHLDSSIRKMFAIGRLTLASEDSQRLRSVIAREIFIQANLSKYIKKKLIKTPCYFDDIEYPLLSLVTQITMAKLGYPQWTSVRASRKIELLQFFLETGHDPNQVYSIQYFGVSIVLTPWIKFITDILHYRNPVGSALAAALEAGILTLFIKHGADPQVLTHHTEKVLLPVWLRFFLLSLETRVAAKHKTSYLRDLRAMFSKPILFDVMTVPVLEDRICSNGNRPVLISLWQYILEKLERISYQNQGLEDLHFLATVVAEFSKATSACGLPWMEAEPVLKDVFPQKSLRLILDSIHGYGYDEESYLGGCGRKRAYDEMTGDEKIAPD